MPWYILAAICTVTVATANIISRAMLKKEESDPIGYSIVFTFLMSIISLVFALILGRFAWPPPIDKLPLQFIAAAVLWALWTVIYFKGVKLLGAGEITILSSLSVFFLVILGVLFLHESVHLIQIIGIILIVISSCLVIFEHVSFKSKKGIILIIISTFISSIALIFDTIIVRQYESFSYLSVMSFLVALTILLFFPRKIKCFEVLKKKQIGPPIILYSIFWTIQAVAYYTALGIGAKVSILSPFVKSSSVITIILAFIFLKEKKYLKRKIAASIITLIGLVLLK